MSQLWGQKTLKTQTTFQALQNRALKKITFKKRKDSATCIYKDLKILKFRDHITQQNCLFVFSLEQNPQLLSSFKIFHCGHTHNYSTRSANKNILDMPFSQIIISYYYYLFIYLFIYFLPVVFSAFCFSAPNQNVSHNILNAIVFFVLFFGVVNSCFSNG